VVAEPRRAAAAFELLGATGSVRQAGDGEAVIGDDALSVGPVTISWLDADRLTSADYRIELHLWPEGRLVLRQLGRRFDTFAHELRRVRNQARVAGMLAHGVTMPDVYDGAVLAPDARPAELQVYDTHVAVVPADDDPWQVPLGAITSVREEREPPGITLVTPAGLTTLGRLGRQRDACLAAITERREAQRQMLAELTGEAGFSDGRGLGPAEVRDCTRLVERFTAPERVPCARTLLSAATADARIGFVQLLDPDRERLQPAEPLPSNWAVFLLVPVGVSTVLEMLAGPSAATYVFREEIEAVNRDLQLLHFRRAPLALSEEQAAITTDNPHRLALRKLEPLRRLRSAMVARIVHNERWSSATEDTLKLASVRFRRAVEVAARGTG
jgi:hypothetical protein